MKLLRGDCLSEMAKLGANTVDTILTDPPYGLSFMGKVWDHGVPGEPFWREALRVAKPGATLMAFGGSRTYHRLTCAIEDAGWEIKDCFLWLYGSGMPKSHNLKRAKINADWDRYGTGLKPAYEPAVIAMKPTEGTYAQNVAKWGVAGFDIDVCRIPLAEGEDTSTKPVAQKRPTTVGMLHSKMVGTMDDRWKMGRWPANVGFVCFCEDEANHEPSCPAFIVDEQASSHVPPSRFFYCAKTSKSERNAGCEGIAPQVGGGLNSTVRGDSRTGHVTIQSNNHPTVKPLALMRYLCRLTKTPTSGVVLDPFMGSGTTGVAALMEGREFIGIELDEHYFTIAKSRIAHAKKDSAPKRRKSA